MAVNNLTISGREPDKSDSSNTAVLNAALKRENDRLLVENRKLSELLMTQRSLAHELERERQKSAEIAFVAEQREEELSALKASECGLREQLQKSIASLRTFDSLSDQSKNQQLEIEKLLDECAKLSTRNGVLTSSLESERRSLEMQAAKNVELSQVCERLAAENQTLLNEKDKLSAHLERQKSELEKAEQAELALAAKLKEANIEHAQIVEKLASDHANYVEKLKALYSGQWRESEKQFQGLMHDRVEWRDSARRELDDLAVFRGKIEQKYLTHPSDGLRPPPADKSAD